MTTYPLGLIWAEFTQPPEEVPDAEHLGLVKPATVETPDPGAPTPPGSVQSETVPTRKQLAASIRATLADHFLTCPDCGGGAS